MEKIDNRKISKPINLKQIQVNDEFWCQEQELVRQKVIPYQWEALNDRVPGAAPSFCMHNFKAAGKIIREKKERGNQYIEPTYTYRGFESLPEDKNHPEPDKFYGFVFQDSDFSKWIEAVGYVLAQHSDPILEQTADEAIDIVCAAQLENGYLDTYYIINGMNRAFTNLKDHHELYCFGHLVEGAVAYYQATGKKKLLEAAIRYADYINSRFGEEEGKCKGYPGHEIAEMALVRLYEITGEEKYLKLSQFFLNQRGTQPNYFDLEERERAAYENRTFQSGATYEYYQAHKPVREQQEAVGHAVRAVYLYSGMADIARLTRDREMLAACEKLWNSIVKEKLYITGGIGSTHIGEAFSFPYDLPNDTAYSETCAAIGLVFFARRMLEIKADSKYADVMETALYNTVLSGMALDGKSFFYVNPLEVVPEAVHKDARKFHVKPVRQKWFGCACCPPNIARLVSSISEYAFTENTDTLWTHLYIGSYLTKKVGERSLDIKIETGFPWNGSTKVILHIDEKKQQKDLDCKDLDYKNLNCKDLQSESLYCRLAFRIPGWAEKAEISVCFSGQQEKLLWKKESPDSVSIEKVKPFKQENQLNLDAEVQNGYVYLSCNWQNGDSIELNFPMQVHIMSANVKVREDIGKVAFTRGPIVYCMEEADNGANMHFNRVDIDAVMEQQKDTYMQNKIEQKIETLNWEGLGHLMTILKVPGKRFTISEGEDKKLYKEYQPIKEAPVILTLIPYYAWGNRGEGEMSVWIRI